tara:strand:- start:91 stop:375 length:285 start_codon:yes stop_codon:yes gene_type:complete
MNDKQHREDTRYMKWADGMYVMLDDLECDYELALIENSLRDSVYFEDTYNFELIDDEDCIGVHLSCARSWWAKDLKLNLTRAQALCIATGDVTI